MTRIGVYENGRYRLENADEVDRRLTAGLAAARAEAARLAEALEFYADVRQYNRVGGDPVGADPPILWDGGLKARAALRADRQEPGEGEVGGG